MDDGVRQLRFGICSASAALRIADGLSARELVDDPPSWLAFYDVRVANACEEESAPD